MSKEISEWCAAQVEWRGQEFGMFIVCGQRWAFLLFRVMQKMWMSNFHCVPIESMHVSIQHCRKWNNLFDNALMGFCWFQFRSELQIVTQKSGSENVVGLNRNFNVAATWSMLQPMCNGRSSTSLAGMGKTPIRILPQIDVRSVDTFGLQDPTSATEFKKRKMLTQFSFPHTYTHILYSRCTPKQQRWTKTTHVSWQGLSSCCSHQVLASL